VTAPAIDAAPSGTAVVVTPTIRSQARKSLFWVAAAVVGLIVAAIVLAASGAESNTNPLSATSPAPGGAKALIEVLRGQGIAVTATSSLAETEKARTDRENATLVIYDPDAILTSGQLTTAAGLTDTVVLIAPDFESLQAETPEIAQASTVNGEATADCDIRAVSNARTVTIDGQGYRVVKTANGAGDAVTCLGSGDGIYSLIQISHGTRTITVLGTTAALSNEHIAERGNAALALTLLGEKPELIWYIPTLADVAAVGPRPISELSPPWVIPVMSLLVLTAIAAAVWRGRRFGPLVVENLPVVVRSSETMEGRARLYATASARLRAIDSLRIGAIARIARDCGLARTATVDEIATAASDATGILASEVTRILVSATPSTDSALVSLSDDLRDLESAVHSATRP
jgi:hypothetical protein